MQDLEKYDLYVEKISYKYKKEDFLKAEKNKEINPSLLQEFINEIKESNDIILGDSTLEDALNRKYFISILRNEIFVNFPYYFDKIPSELWDSWMQRRHNNSIRIKERERGLTTEYGWRL